MERFYGVNIKEQREKLLNSPLSEGLVADIIKSADDVLDEKYEVLKISDYMMFLETGDRKRFESGYFRRRNNCLTLSAAYWLTEDEKYRKPLTDLIFHICDEFTWLLPAHAHLGENRGMDFWVTHIDLFQAETARLLTEIDAILGDRLPTYVKERIEYEVRRRIMTARDFWWCNGSKTNNWAAVCGSGVGVAVMHFGIEKEIKEILPVLDKGMEYYIEDFDDDGCCLEGYQYWSFGFGNFLIYAMAILDYSDGKINLFENEKVKQIAMFPQRVRMGKSKVACFSDGDNGFTFNKGIFCLLRKMYGEEFIYPSLEYATYNGMASSIKELLWFDTEYQEDKDELLTTYFKDAQWYIKQGKKYSFAAKGGHNDEPHNHNDIGSFMIVDKNDDIPLADLGFAIYRRETFEEENRYKLINNGSHGHSVPIINNEYQKAGKIYRAENVKAGEDFFELDIEGAYEEGLCKRINRRFELKEESIILRDTFEYSDKTKNITERFISYTKPEICDGFVDLKTAKIVYDKEMYTVSFSETSFRNHANTEDVTVYLIDFQGVNEGKFEVEITLSCGAV